MKLTSNVKNVVLFLIVLCMTQTVLSCNVGSSSGAEKNTDKERGLIDTLQSHMSAEDLLGLPEVHLVEDKLVNYNNFKVALKNPKRADCYIATHRDSAAMRLANRFLNMSDAVDKNGSPMDKIQWVIAVDVALHTFSMAEPSVPYDSAIYEIIRVVDKFSSQSQMEMNFCSYVHSKLEYYHTIEAYRRWMSVAPKKLRPLIQEEYEAWYGLNNARYAFWSDVVTAGPWYSLKPMELNGYYANLAINRRMELEVESDIIRNGTTYHQRGGTVTTTKWHEWIAENSNCVYNPDGDFSEIYDSCDSITGKCIKELLTSFSTWLTARHRLTAALPKEQAVSYDNMTADIHCRMIGKLKDIVPLNAGDY